MLINQLLEEKTHFQSKYLDEPIINLGDKTFVIPEQFDYDVIEVTDAYVARMDLISIKAYGTNQLSDLLCKVNGISNPFELNEGMLILIPSFNDISKFFYKETTEESDTTQDHEGRSKPKAKTKKEKRKANEAVIGDKRYRIDSSHKVIIY